MSDEFIRFRNYKNRVALPFRVRCVSALRVTCATRLFQNSVGEALIRERTGHRSDALLRYERKSEELEKIVSTVLGPPAILKGNVISDLTEDLSTDISLPDFHFDVLDEVLRNYPMPTSDLSEGLGTDDCLPDFYFDVPDEVLSNYPMPVTETVSNINTTLSNCAGEDLEVSRIN